MDSLPPAAPSAPPAGCTLWRPLQEARRVAPPCSRRRAVRPSERRGTAPPYSLVSFVFISASWQVHEDGIQKSIIAKNELLMLLQLEHI